MHRSWGRDWRGRGLCSRGGMNGRSQRCCCTTVDESFAERVRSGGQAGAACPACPWTTSASIDCSSPTAWKAFPDAVPTLLPCYQLLVHATRPIDRSRVCVLEPSAVHGASRSKEEIAAWIRPITCQPTARPQRSRQASAQAHLALSRSASTSDEGRRLPLETHAS